MFLKPGVLDVQGKAVEGALHGLGWPGAADVRVGRVIAFDFAAADRGEAEAQVKAMCDKLARQHGDRELPGGGRLLKAAVVVFPGSNCDRDCKVGHRALHGRHGSKWSGTARAPCPPAST